MPLMWRGMRIAGEEPEVGRGALLLGVRVGLGDSNDIDQDSEGCVHPGQGGMSVSPDLEALPPPASPPSPACLPRGQRAELAALLADGGRCCCCFSA